MSRLIELVKEGASIEKVEVELYRPCFVGYIDVQDNEGRTALMYAALRGDAAMVQLLLQSGADVYISSTIDGATAYLCAIISGHTEVATILTNYRNPHLKSPPLEPTQKSNPTTEFISIAERVIGDYYAGLPTEATEDNCETIKWLTLDMFKELFLKELKKDATAGIYIDFIPKWVNFISHDLDMAALKTLLMLGDGEYICSSNNFVILGEETIYLPMSIVPRDICLQTNKLVCSANSIIYNKVKEELFEEYAKRFANNAMKGIHLEQLNLHYCGYFFCREEVINGAIKKAKEKYNIQLNKIVDGRNTFLINPNYIDHTNQESPTESPPIQAAPKKGFFDFLKRK